jgi:cytochrome c551/c552
MHATSTATSPCRRVRLQSRGLRQRQGPVSICEKYAGEDTAESRLVAKVKAGGGGIWGPVPMPAQTQLPDADARVLVQWILAGAK